MAQLKRYNGTSWENVGGSVAPKTSQTTSDTDTYSCNYVNNNLTNIKSAIDYKSPDYMGDVVVESIKSKNMFNSSTIVQGDIVNGAPTLRMTSRQIIWLEPGTYTASTNMSSSYQWGIQIQNVGIPPLSTYPTYIYTTNWLNTGTTNHTFTINTAGWFTLMTRRSDNGSFTSTDITNLKAFNYQLETGNAATTYSPYQNLTGEESYSTEETKIGTWLGKPLYRKVISGGTVTATNTQIGTISNLDNLASIRGTAHSTALSNQYYNIPNTHGDNSSYYIDALVNNGSEVRIRFGTGITQLEKVYVIVEYTKTTD